MLRSKPTNGGCQFLNSSSVAFSRVERLELRLLFSVAYTLTDLGTIGGGDAFPAAINNAGQITGTVTSASGVSHVFLWSKGKMTDLGTLVPGASSVADAISSNGDVSGYGNLTSAVDSDHPITIHKGIIKDLGVLPGYSFSEAQGINAGGQVVGYANKGDPDLDEAFIYANGKMTDLGPQLGGISNAKAINDAGTAVGYGTGSNGNPEAFVYSNGKATMLGMPQFDNYSMADAINSTGTEIAGTAGLFDFDASAAFVYKNGIFTSFQSLSPDFSVANGVNASGVVVGNYQPNIIGNDTSHAWVYQDSGSPQDLTDLIDPSLGIKLDAATGINDAGQIIAAGTVDGHEHAFLLNPVADGSISGTLFNDLNGDGKRQAGEGGLAGRTVFIDANHNGVLNPSELSAVTDANGHYAFTGLAPGSYTITQMPISDWNTTATVTNLKLAAGQNIAGANIGNQQILLYSVIDITGPQSLAEVTGFNNAGQIVGDFFNTDANGNGTNYGFLYQNNHLTLIGSATQDTSGLTINSAGQINGLTTDKNGNQFYFLYSKGKLVPAKEPANYGSVMNDLGGFAGALNFSLDKGPSWSTAYVDINGKKTVLGPTDDPDISSTIAAINNLGQALGDGQISYNGPTGVFIYSNGKPHWLTNVPGFADDLNDNGQIVGTYFAPSGVYDAYIYNNGQTIDLNNALSTNTGLTLSDANYINNSGAIVVGATDAYYPDHILLLTPILGSVSGSVFNDINRNGSKQTTEPPLKGIRVYADVNNNHRWDPGEPFGVTNAAGQYTIPDVPSDGVIIRQVLQTGWTQTAPATNAGAWADLSPGQNISIPAFAQSAIPASITGSVFNDKNADGIRQAAEKGLPDVLVYIDLGNHHQFESGDPFATTDASGNYTIAELQPGSYVVRSQPITGFKQTTPAISATIYGGQQLSVSPIGQTTG